MNDEALLREKAATLTRMLNLQGTIGMFGHVSVRVPGIARRSQVLPLAGGGPCSRRLAVAQSRASAT
jgi:hypothetical protein